MVRTRPGSLPAMRDLMLALVAVALLATACGGDEADATTTSTDVTTTSTEVEQTTSTAAVRTQPVGASSFFAINEVGLGPDGYVSLTNFTDVPVTLAGLYLCQRPNYIELPDVLVEAGATVRVALGDGAGLENVVVTNASLGDLNPSDGEIAIYTSRDFDDSAAIIEYLEWGSTPHGRTNVAIAAGLWPEGSFAPTSATATRLFRVPESGLWLFEPNE